ncbi:hypothetical protein ACFRI7_32275 [Streptomyces sp. NPDC056716]|uniref:hypothetical protein n=1 Tax=unclassified Streptomyces TaxID=2593676 RepID=UPI0036B7D95D
MPRRSAPTALAVTALAVLALSFFAADALSPAGTGPLPATATPHTSTVGTPPASVLSSEQLRDRLLGESDLGRGYTLKPEQAAAERDDVTVIGCPALEHLGGQAGAGGPLAFPNRATAAFTHTGDSGGELSVELYSDTPARLAEGTGQIFAAMASCPLYQVVIGSTPVKVTTHKLPATALGDEQWSHLLTFTAAGRDTLLKQTAIRAGTVLVVVSGSPGLVDTHIEKALAKAATSN